jgi:probable HAF family extracellular repeat protein
LEVSLAGGSQSSGVTTVAGAINDAGQVAVADGNSLALYNNGTLTVVWPFSDPSSGIIGATGINSTGQIVGNLENYDNGNGVSQNGFLYSNGTLQSLTALYTANAINSLGHIAGAIGSSSPSSAALYENGSVQSLGTLGGNSASAMAINDSGYVVGWSLLSNNTTQHAFLYQGGTMYDLNSLVIGSPYTFVNAVGINAAGQVLAAAQLNNVNGTSSYSCILSPQQGASSDGPLPAWSYLLLAAGLAVIAGTRMRNMAL